jgi:hypothetical protein
MGELSADAPIRFVVSSIAFREFLFDPLLLVELVALTTGLVIGVGVIAVVAYWVLTRPKPWNTNAVTARFKKQIIYENHDKPNEIHYYPNVFFDVTNNTGTDYVLPVDAWQHHLMENQSGSLLGSSGWILGLSHARMPYNIPDDFFEPKPVLIPAHTTVEIDANFDFSSAAERIKRKTKEQVVAEEFPNTDGLVAFDEAAHYRISFPMKGSWGAEQPISASLNRENTASKQKKENKVVQISGGELLKIADSNGPSMPIVYLGHQQTFVLACGDTGQETKDSIRLEEVHVQPSGKVSCP